MRLSEPYPDLHVPHAACGCQQPQESALHTHWGVPLWLHSSEHSTSSRSSGFTPRTRSFCSMPMNHASSSGLEVHTYLRLQRDGRALMTTDEH